MLDALFASRKPQRWNVSIGVALERHLAWQQRLLEQTRARGALGKSTSFLLLRPGDKLTVCDAAGMDNVRSRCWKGRAPPVHRHPLEAVSGPPEPHWDVVMTEGRRRALTRPVPGIGNIALSLVSAAVTAIVSRRVLQVENWTMAAESLGAPMPSLLLETSGWLPYVSRLQASGDSVDWFAAHDDYTAFGPLCSHDLRHSPGARLWRIFSNQYFLPLLLLNQHHAAHVEAMGSAVGVGGGGGGRGGAQARRGQRWRRQPSGDGASGVGGGGGSSGGGLWGPALRTLVRPQQRLLAAADAYVRTARLEAPPEGEGGGGGGGGGQAQAQARVLGMHARSAFEARGQLARVLRCARARLRAHNASHLFLATMAKRTREQMRDGLRRGGDSDGGDDGGGGSAGSAGGAGGWGGAEVAWYGEAVGVQGESKHKLDAAVLDLHLLGRLSREILVSRVCPAPEQQHSNSRAQPASSQARTDAR